MSNIYIFIIIVLLIILNLFLFKEIRNLKKSINKIEKAFIPPVDTRDDDELLVEAKKLIISSGKASAAYLQRRLSIGYARAARLLDLLEEEGFVGRSNGAEPREILN